MLNIFTQLCISSLFLFYSSEAYSIFDSSSTASKCSAALFGGISLLLLYTSKRAYSLTISFFVILHRALYLASMVHVFDVPNISKILYAGIFLFSALDFARICTLSVLFKNFSTEERIKWYSDVINFERLLRGCLYGGNRLSTEDVIDLLNRSTKRHDPKTIFALLSNSQNENMLTAKFALLNIVKSKLKDENTSFSAKNLLLEEDSQVSTSSLKLENLTHDDEYWMKHGANSFNEAIGENINNDTRKNTELSFSACRELLELEKYNFKGKIRMERVSRFLDPGDAHEFMRILTQGFSSELSYSEFEDNIRQMNNERTNFVSTLRNNNRTASIFRKCLIALELMAIIMFCISFFESVAIIKKILIPIMIFFILVFCRLFDSFAFLLHVHPYDIGDRIYIDGDNLVVKDMGLVSTTFERWNNEYVVMGNRYINQRPITNLRRSKNQQWRVEICISASIKEKCIERLVSSMREFAASNPAFEKLSAEYDELTNCEKLKIIFIVRHSINYQNGYFTCYVQNKFMKKLAKECNVNNIRYVLPKLNISYA
ncbi:hypothetical protein ENBRE01_1872 [Enteropsectra breve]|nr:hypothetical protein ENBRE01_1872 [Enteropsectra breve]